MKHVWCLSIWWMVPGPWQMINASPMVIMSLTKQNIQFYLIVSAILFSIVSYNCSSCIALWSYERQLLPWHYNSCHLRAYYVRANTLCFTWLNSFNPHNSPLAICYYPHFIDKKTEAEKYSVNCQSHTTSKWHGWIISSSHLSRKFLCYPLLYFLYYKLFYKSGIKKNDMYQSGHSNAIAIKIVCVHKKSRY